VWSRPCACRYRGGTNGVARVLVVDDDPSLRRVLTTALQTEGYHVDTAENAAQADDCRQRTTPDAVLLDLSLPDASGLTLLRRWGASDGLEPVIVLTAQNTVSNAIQAMQLGAFDYVTKPFDLDALYELLADALRVAQDGDDVAADGSPEPDATPVALVGTSTAMQHVYKTIGRLAATDATVLIQGESGTGKELAARAMHTFSERKQAPFVAVNMAAIPADLLEAELFGYEKGAFTGATQASPGKFRSADGGTLLLDEIGDMPLSMQGKLLRVLEERALTPLGARQAVPVDVRVLAATQVPLENAVESGRFRADLYYRLRVVDIILPPLRERRADIPELAKTFLHRMVDRGEIAPKQITDDALVLLRAHDWPGNVRELENMIRRVALLHSKKVLGPEAFRELGLDLTTADDKAGPTNGFAAVVEDELASFIEAMYACDERNVWDMVQGAVEPVVLKLALQTCKGNQLKAARLLGLNRNTLRKKLTAYEIDPRRFRR